MSHRKVNKVHVVITDLTNAMIGFVSLSNDIYIASLPLRLLKALSSNDVDNNNNKDNK